MNSAERDILELIRRGENLPVEFKSDARSLPALIANKTIPSMAVRVELIELEGQLIARIHVPKSRQLVSTSDGLLQRRRLKMDGSPEAVPFYPHEFVQRQSSLGVTDPSALPLADEELDGALGLTVTVSGKRHPTVAGLLLLGDERQLRQHLPSHEVAFQVLRGTDVLVNEFYRKPLLETFEEVELLFRARVEEEEIQIGLFRVPIPNFDRRAFREAFVNALVHRDYSALGAVHVRLDDDGLSISNPGGFVEGVNLDNLLVADPRSRNPLLADIIKRIGLAERTGRGIDRIFEGMLRYGRTAPDYSMSSAYTVAVRMSAANADAEFLRMIVQREEQIGTAMPIDSLIILSRLRNERRLRTTDLARSVQKPETVVRGTLEKLVEAGVVEAHSTGKGRTYTLSVKVYQGAGEKAAYVRQAGFEPIQQEQMVLNFIDTHGSIKRADVIELCHISPDQAYKLLAKLKKKDLIKQAGERKGAIYERAR